MRTILLIAIVFCCRPASAQIAFIQEYGVDTLLEEGNAVVQAADSGYYLAGYNTSYSIPEGKGIIVRTDKYGNVLWTKYYSMTGVSHIHFDDIAKTSDGNLVVTGLVYYNVNDFDIYLAKMDTAGNVIWEKSLGGLYRQRARQVVETPDKGFVVCGFNDTLGIGTLPAELYIIKTDSVGDSLWSKRYSDGREQYAQGIAVMSDSGFAICGSIEQTGSLAHTSYVVRTDKYGDTLWTKVIGQFPVSSACDVEVAGNGNVVITGFNSFAGPCQEAFLAELDAQGNTVWDETYSGGSCASAYSVCRTTDNGYALGGRDTAGNFYIVKTNSTGTEQWSRKMDVSPSDWSHCIEQTSDGGYIVAGNVINDTNNLANMVLVKLDENGYITSVPANVMKSSSFRVYPNPVRDVLYIESKAGVKLLSVQLYDIAGRMVVNSPSTSLIRLDDSIAPGLYFLMLRTGSGEEVVKVVKE